MVASLVVATLTTLLAATGTAQAQTTEYVALGDSYASGVGTREYIEDGSGCSRSTYAYPSLIAAGTGADFTFAACSGAETGDLIANQLGALSDSTDLVTVTIGGNDTGWASVIQQCAYPSPWTCDAEIAAAERYIDEQLPTDLSAAYDAIAAAAPNARVIVLGYPRLFNGEECNAITRISSAEQAALNNAADHLGRAIASVAGGYGFEYIDVRDSFEGHAICDDTEWLNGFSWPVAESYHPNRAGQAGYYDLLSALV
ncbi:SGNH/GDSL hydrolase family protein [Glycomyces buryatensis]|nr:SGNH/GDSL hydrolase family protein [Glycomyces buryatensis]